MGLLKCRLGPIKWAAILLHRVFLNTQKTPYNSSCSWKAGLKSKDPRVQKALSRDAVMSAQQDDGMAPTDEEDMDCDFLDRGYWTTSPSAPWVGSYSSLRL